MAPFAWAKLVFLAFNMAKSVGPMQPDAMPSQKKIPGRSLIEIILCSRQADW